MRHRMKEEEKKKRITFTIDPRVLELFEEYCEMNGIEKRSEFIEKILIKKINESKL